MNPEDRIQLDALNRRHAQLEIALEKLKADIRQLEHQVEGAPELVQAPTVPPPLPPPLTWDEAPAPETPITAEPSTTPFYFAAKIGDVPPPVSTPLPLPPLPKMTHTEETPQEPGPGIEFQFGRWLARIGVVLLLITLISASIWVYNDYVARMGPWPKLALLTLVSGGIAYAGLRLERKENLLVYGRTLAAGGLAGLYYTLYGATYVKQLHVISSPLLGGFLLLCWSAWVLSLAEKRRSELLSIFAIALAYFSSAITPVGEFTMVADLLLAATAVVFLLRNEWTGLSWLCLIGTYAGFVRQVVPERGPSIDWFELSHAIHFWPSAIYLLGAWIIFTAGVFLANSPRFQAENRMTFLCINNGALIGLIVTADQLSGFGHIGAILCIIGALFLGAWLLAKQRLPELTGAYLMQGLAVATSGLVLAYSGVTRGLLITAEAVFLGAAGAYSRNIIVRIAANLAALLGTAFLIVEIGFEDHYPWTLTFSGAAAMLASAWFARREFWNEPREKSRERFVYESAYYIILALVVLITGCITQPHDAWVAPDLAFIALALSLVVYLVPLFELTPLSQGLLVLAQLFAFVAPMITLYDRSTPVPQDQWSPNLVALVTMILATWLPRQKQVHTQFWLPPLLMIYALAMVAFACNAIQPHESPQEWLIVSALLPFAFLAYAAWSRSWQFMLAGQAFLLLSIIQFFTPDHPFPWTWWAALVPVAATWSMAWLLRSWIPRIFNNDRFRDFANGIAYLYESVALALLVRWIFAIVPEADWSLAFASAAVILMLLGFSRANGFGVRRSFVFSAFAIFSYFDWTNGGSTAFTWPNAGAALLLIAQPALLRHWGRELITEAESWVVVLVSSLFAWIFVHQSVATADENYLTLGWGLFALTLILIGFAGGERRQRWCGLGVLVAAISRVGVHDFWLFSDGYKVLTFFVLTVICLGLSYLYYRYSDRLKEWL